MNGVDVAKDAAKIILLEKDLAVLNEGVVEGRRCFANIMKYIIMATSSNFGNMFSMAAASLFLKFLKRLAACGPCSRWMSLRLRSSSSNSLSASSLPL